MKTLSNLVLAIFLFIGFTSYAQKAITVVAVNKEMSRGMQPGFMVNIPEAKAADIIAAYEKRLEENTKTNAKVINGELINYGAVNRNFSEKPFIIYAKVLETVEGVELTAFITEDSTNFIGENSEPDKVAAFKKALHEFSVAEYKDIVAKQLEVEKSKLAELKKTLEKQINEESSNKKEIGQKQRDIETSKTRIEESKVQRAAKGEQIGNQQKLADGIGNKNSPEYELAVKNLKKYEGEKRDMEKNEEKLGKSIDEDNAEIKEIEHENESLVKQQEDTKQKITEQETVVKGFEAKMNGIK